MLRKLVLITLLGTGPLVLAHGPEAGIRYLGNEGVLVHHGDTRILFDPLFRESFGQYELPPAAIREAMLGGEPPFAGVDAVFISHHHGDHFDPADISAYLRAQPGVRLFAPRQAVDAIRETAGATADIALLERLTAIDIDVGDAPLRLEAPGLRIDVVRIPHSGWPSRHANVENLAWRVTLDDGPTVLHLGDADTRVAHFSRDAAHWSDTPLELAMPPYWFFLSSGGREVLADHLRPDHAIGIHVPKSVPDDPAARDEALQGADLFTRPGETRVIEH